ncbi:MAG: translation initiation factor IF-2, partial [Halobacteriaceae archaeon]
DAPIQETYDAQPERTRAQLDEKIYEIIGQLSDEGFSSDFYWRVQDFRNNIGVIPVSAETGEGVPDLLTVLMGLSQRYMKEEMEIDIAGPGAGTVLEVTEERGFGTTIDAILYDGSIEEGDTIVVGGLNGSITTDVRALLEPRELTEMRAEKEFQTVDRREAAAGLKIAAPGLDDALAGAPIRVVRNGDVEAVKDEVESELAELEVSTGEEGVVVKADTLGSLEALANALEEAEIPIMRAEVGDVAPRDVSVASTVQEDEHRAILAFSVDVMEEAAEQAEHESVKIYRNDVIYQLVEEYEEFIDELERKQREAVFENILRPARFQVLPDHTFRQSNPAVVGVEVLSGTLRRNAPIAKKGDDEFERVGTLTGIQDQGEEKHAKVLEQELLDDLPADEREALSMFLDTKRSQDPFWGK